jgi:hypothetical protein
MNHDVRLTTRQPSIIIASIVSNLRAPHPSHYTTDILPTAYAGLQSLTLRRFFDFRKYGNQLSYHQVAPPNLEMGSGRIIRLTQGVETS